MAIDLEALRRKHEQLNGGGTTSNNSDFLNKFYQIPEGSNAVRILPGKDDDHEFYAETKIHRVTGPDGTLRTTTAVRCMVRLAPCATCTTVCGRQVRRKTRILRGRLSLALVTT